MEHREFAEIRAKVEFLSSRQVLELMEGLRQKIAPEDVCQEIERSFLRQRHCPHCTSKNLHLWGVAHGLQRYRCKVCRRTFNALTGTSFARLRMKQKWPRYFQALQETKSVRTAAHLVDVAKNTSFRWRHRFLQPNKSSKDQKLNLIVEIDETFFRESFKGKRNLPRPARKRGGNVEKPGLSSDHIPVLLALDRLGHKVDGVLPNRSQAAVTEVLQGRISDDALLCMDGDKALVAFAEKQGLEYELIIASKGEHVHEKVLHIQNVNAYTSRLKKWMRLFNGVATKYLQNYVGWRRWLERSGREITPFGAFRQALAPSTLNGD